MSRTGAGRRLVKWPLTAAVLVGLILWPATASGGQATSNAKDVTLTVSITGTGAGWVTAGASAGSDGLINCVKLNPAASSCPGQFTANITATLVAQAAVGSTFAGFSTAAPYQCGSAGGSSGLPPGQGWCEIYLSDTPGNASVQATFTREPPPCVVPGLKGRSLIEAKHLIKIHNCRVGTISYAFSSSVKKRHVISQNPKAHWRLKNGKVDLVVSKGRR